MSTATMHFGPEWMRTRNQPLSRSQLESSPPLNALPHATSTLATYSALVSVTPVAPEKVDESHPFRYSKEELLAIYQEGGKGGLGLEVDRWEGVVREVAVEPVTLREMTDAEKKVCCC
jgi:PERQ amino acid-rich with GYF domain-containing protein